MGTWKAAIIILRFYTRKRGGFLRYLLITCWRTWRVITCDTHYMLRFFEHLFFILSKFVSRLTKYSVVDLLNT